MNKTSSKHFKDKRIKLTAYGAAGEVGRSAFIIEDGKRAILLDAGIKLRPKEELSLAPEGLKKEAHKLDAVVLSHAHVDHSGYLPALYENGYYGKIYMTHPTKEIVYVLWKDHIKIEGSRHWNQVGLERAYDSIETINYRKPTEIVNGVTVEFFNSGHILGSAMILIDWEGFKILYTGDINDQQTPLFDGFDIPECEVDVIITESTNGLRQITPREQVNQQFIEEVKKTLKSGKKVVIPSFAIGRSQEVLSVLTESIKDYPIYVDGMINLMNTITEKYLTSDWVDQPMLDRLKRDKTFSPFRSNNVVPITTDSIDNTFDFRNNIGENNDPIIILTTSGMMEPSPLHTHLRHTADDEGNLLAITGYQAEGTTGREILEGKRKVKLSVSRNEEVDVEIKNRIIQFGFSGHSSSEGIADLIEAVKPKQIFLVHGDPVNQVDVIQKLTNGIIPKSLEPMKKEILNSKESLN